MRTECLVKRVEKAEEMYLKRREESLVIHLFSEEIRRLY